MNAVLINHTIVASSIFFVNKFTYSSRIEQTKFGGSNVEQFKKGGRSYRTKIITPQ